MDIAVAKVLIGLFAGVGVGLFYFAGLWWTVKRMPGKLHPWVWALGSFLLRAGISMGVIYLTTGGLWQGVLSAMAGFYCARFVVVRCWGCVSAENMVEGA